MGILHTECCTPDFPPECTRYGVSRNYLEDICCRSWRAGAHLLPVMASCCMHTQVGDIWQRPSHSTFSDHKTTLQPLCYALCSSLQHATENRRPGQPLNADQKSTESSRYVYCTCNLSEIFLRHECLTS